MSIRIGIAEPNATLRISYQARLAWECFKVATASNGLECLEMLRSFKPDLLVLEPEIPWGGGEGVLEVMHDVFEVPLASVFVITSPQHLASLDPQQFVRQFPLVTHMQTKPVGPDELVRLIRHIANEPRPIEEVLRWARSTAAMKRQHGVRDGRPTNRGDSPRIGVRS